MNDTDKVQSQRAIRMCIALEGTVGTLMEFQIYPFGQVFRNIADNLKIQGIQFDLKCFQSIIRKPEAVRNQNIINFY